MLFVDQVRETVGGKVLKSKLRAEHAGLCGGVEIQGS